MPPPTSRPAIGLAPAAPARPGLALALALLSILLVLAGSSLAPGGWGAGAIPFALAAIVARRRARGRLDGHGAARAHRPYRGERARLSRPGGAEAKDGSNAHDGKGPPS